VHHEPVGDHVRDQDRRLAHVVALDACVEPLAQLGLAERAADRRLGDLRHRLLHAHADRPHHERLEQHADERADRLGERVRGRVDRALVASSGHAGGRLHRAMRAPRVLYGGAARGNVRAEGEVSMRTFVVVSVMILSACGGSGDLGRPFGPVALAGYAATAREAYCRQLVRCGEVEDLATCARVNVQLIVLAPANPADIDDGTAIYDPVQAGLCLDAIATASCDPTSEERRAPIAACSHVLTGTLLAGVSCAADRECISGRCDKSSPQCPPGDGCCTGVCAGDTPPTLAAVGASCANADCERGAYCDGLTCQALRPLAAACNSQEQCGYGLVCDLSGTVFGDGTCAVPPGPGEPCGLHGFCRDDGTVCGFETGRCVRLALGGERCGGDTLCSPVYTCDPATSTCTTGAPLGAACTTTTLCADPVAFCDIALGQSSGICAVPQPDGAVCTTGQNCQSFHCDPSHHCAPALRCE
jgi:hypothetical protein